jgi:outer membrane protein OmpA-like peptidoglycan-associated protein
MGDYSVERTVSFADMYPESEFSVYGFKIGAQADYQFDLNKEIKIKPFIQLRGGLSINDDIKEKNGQEANLLIDANNNLRAEAIVGIELDRKLKDFDVYMKAFSGYTIAGNVPKYDISFQGALDAGKMDIWGAEEGPLDIGMVIGTRYNISRIISAWIDISGTYGIGANEGHGYYANIGLSAKIGGAKKAPPIAEKEPEPKIEPPLPEPEPTPIVEVPPAPTPIVSPPMPVKAQVEAAKERRKAAIQSFKLSAATFRSGSAVLSPIAKKNIRSMANKIKELDYKKITVEGHTDSSGKTNANFDLSRRRAKSVYDEFIKAGIPIEAMEYIGFGPAMPTASNATATGKARNRRVEIFVE